MVYAVIGARLLNCLNIKWIFDHTHNLLPAAAIATDHALVGLGQIEAGLTNSDIGVQILERIGYRAHHAARLTEQVNCQAPGRLGANARPGSELLAEFPHRPR